MTKKETQFIEQVWDFYSKQGRTELPWRKTKDPYKILVSEVMLQQTQVERVKGKYAMFLKAFPTVFALAEAPLREVLLLWQGLGYNRRAKMLHRCAQEIVRVHDGVFPKNDVQLQALPGIGPYTAGAVMAFAYNKALPIIETNIRSVYLHHFFKDRSDITDAQLVRYILLTLDQKNPREWYYALMDYGSHIKKAHGNPNSKSAHYAVQSRFKGSDRQIRGALLRVLLKEPLGRTALLKKLSSHEDARIDAQVERLLSENMLIRSKGKLMIP